jgi:hypothetical protein
LPLIEIIAPLESRLKLSQMRGIICSVARFSNTQI